MPAIAFDIKEDVSLEFTSPFQNPVHTLAFKSKLLSHTFQHLSRSPLRDSFRSREINHTFFHIKTSDGGDQTVTIRFRFNNLERRFVHMFSFAEAVPIRDIVTQAFSI